MVHTWRCLLNSSELIISIIDIFVNEQSVNWLKQRKDQGERGPSASARNAEWMPMNIIKKKLRCHNPIRILLEELRANQQTNLPEIYCSLIENGNREKIKPEKVSEERVVELLIDLATDKNLLCRIFYGWAPWV
jgi:phosphatidylinositol kinase/protein kinase (PI-3  family)